MTPFQTNVEIDEQRLVEDKKSSFLEVLRRNWKQIAVYGTAVFLLLSIIFIVLLLYYTAESVDIQASSATSSNILPTTTPTNVASNTTPFTTTYNAEGWRKVAQMLEQGIDDTVEPCDNFYDFVCGNFKENHIFELLNNNLEDDLNSAFKNLKATDASKKPKAVQQMKSFLQKCESSTRFSDFSSLKSFIGKSLGGFPILSEEDKQWKPFELSGMLAALGMGHSNNIFSLHLLPDWDNLDKGQTIYLDIDEEYSGTIDYRIDDMLRELSNTYIMSDQQKQDMKDMTEFQQSLDLANRYTLNFTKLINYQQETTLSEAQAKWPHIEWGQFLTGLAKQGGLDTQDLLKEPFVVRNTKYVDELDTLLKNTPARTLQNYLVYTFLNKNIKFDYGYGRMRLSCDTLVKYKLPYLVARVYLDEMEPNLGLFRDGVRYFYELVLQGYKSMIDETTWLTEESKRKTKEKLASVVANIGYPDWLLDDQKLNAHHPEEKLGIEQNDNLFEMYSKVISFQGWSRLQQVLKPIDRSEQYWVETFNYVIFNFPEGLTHADPQYQPHSNSFIIPMGYLQPPLASPTYPVAWLFGSVADTMAHELGHSIDADTISRGKYGSHNPWLDFSSQLGFKKMSQCLIDQYSDFCDPGIFYRCVDGNLTLGENMADNTGIKAAHQAYKSHVQKFGAQPRLEGKLSKYSMEQIFFMSAARKYCQEEGLDVYYDVHSPNSFRVVGMLQNLPAFSQAFSCDRYSVMNNSNRCNVWS